MKQAFSFSLSNMESLIFRERCRTQCFITPSFCSIYDANLAWNSSKWKSSSWRNLRKVSFFCKFRSPSSLPCVLKPGLAFIKIARKYYVNDLSWNKDCKQNEVKAIAEIIHLALYLNINKNFSVDVLTSRLIWLLETQFLPCSWLNRQSWTCSNVHTYTTLIY